VYRRLIVLEIGEVVRLLRVGESDRKIVELLGLNRRTVAKYRSWAREQGVLEGAVPPARKLQELLDRTLPKVVPPQQGSTVAPYREEISALRTRGLEVAAIRTRLEERHQTPISYSAIWRLVQQLEPKQPDAVVRVEAKPGSEAQVDFGFAGWVLDPADGRARKAWVFVLVLAWSRHLYAEVVFDQRLETWLLCHRHAFEYLGGVPERVVVDNLKSAIVRASVQEPVAQRSYRECAEHYGFLIDPNPPLSPWLKGKVEQGGVHYVKRNFLAGRDPEPRDELNRKLRDWGEQVAGGRVHGTTRQAPLERFRAVERDALQPLPRDPYDLAVWAKLQVHRDCHVTFEQSDYSAPFGLVGQDLWVRGGSRTVELYTADHQLVATHDRAPAKGMRLTRTTHLPAEKVPGLILNREDCRAQAAGIGPATQAIVERLLAHRPEDRLKVAGRLLRLGTPYGAERLERACARAERFGEGEYVAVKRILLSGHDQELLPAVAPPPATAAPRSYTFMRPVTDLVAGLMGGLR
jgi:transposase